MAEAVNLIEQLMLQSSNRGHFSPTHTSDMTLRKALIRREMRAEASAHEVCAIWSHLSSEAASSNKQPFRVCASWTCMNSPCCHCIDLSLLGTSDQRCCVPYTAFNVCQVTCSRNRSPVYAQLHAVGKLLVLRIYACCALWHFCCMSLYWISVSVRSTRGRNC